MKSVCRGCGLAFSGERAFDRHRVVDFNHTPPKYGRRCLTVAELEADGWRVNASWLWTCEKVKPSGFTKSPPVARARSSRRGDRRAEVARPGVGSVAR